MLKVGVIGGLAYTAFVIFGIFILVPISSGFICLSQLVNGLILACTGVLAVRYTRIYLKTVPDAVTMAGWAGAVAGFIGGAMFNIVSTAVQLSAISKTVSEIPGVVYNSPLSFFSIAVDLGIMAKATLSGIILAAAGSFIYTLLIAKMPGDGK